MPREPESGTTMGDPVQVPRKEAAMVASTGTSNRTHGRMPLPAEPLLIDQFMPTYDLAIVHSRVFRAPSEQCFDTVVDFDLFQIPAFRVLVGARGLPQRLADALPGRAGQAGVSSAPPTFRLRDMPSMGWMLLGERPGVELTFGQVGKPWKPRGGAPDNPVTRAEFAAFDQPGFAKLVESTRVDPYGERSAIVTTETRVACTDQDSRRRFRRYWLVVGPCSHLLRGIALRMYARKLEGPG
jgi:hypothetical protein